MKKLRDRLSQLIKIGTSLYVIGTSLYDISDDITVMRKEHGLLLIGMVGFVKTCFEIYKKSRELKTEIDTDLAA